MENGITAGELALIENRGGWGGYNNCGYDYRHRNGMAATGIGLGAGLGGAALLAALVGVWGVNSASKSRAEGAAQVAAAQSKTMEVLAGIVNREATRADGINIDVNQTLRSLTAASATGGSASALANAEALALALNNNSGVNSAIGGCNYLRVARVSGSRLCGCDGNCCGE